MRTAIVILTALFILTGWQQTIGQIWIGVEGGGSKTVGDDYEEWDWGFTAAADIWAQGNRFVWLGGRVGYNRWPSPRDDEFLEQIDTLLTGGDVSGEAYVIEFVPMVRLNSGLEESAFNIFIQGGPGLFILDNEVTVEGAIAGTDFEQTFGEDNVARLGLTAGGGVTIGSFGMIMFEAFPLVNVIFSDEETFTYLTLNVGVSLGL